MPEFPRDAEKNKLAQVMLIIVGIFAGIGFVTSVMFILYLMGHVG